MKTKSRVFPRFKKFRNPFSPQLRTRVQIQSLMYDSCWDGIIRVWGTLFQCNEYDFYEMFKGLKVADVFIERSESGRCSGIVFVSFETKSDALKNTS